MSFTDGDMHSSSDDPCILGLNNGTYPNGTRGDGKWNFGHYVPTSAERAACQAWHGPWASSVRYGWWTTLIILAPLTALAAVNAVKKIHNLSRIHRLPSAAYFHPRLAALFRYASYPQARLLQGFLPSLGPSLIIVGFLFYSIALCFLWRPYYRPPNYGSPPLGLRSEWVATALVPWIFAAATKCNFLAAFSGVSFQRILTFHKWMPWICLIMSVVHAWSMIIQANSGRPWWYSLQSDPSYWNGFPALAALTWLCLMSLGPIRCRFYETFYIWHIIAAIFFVVWMYIHVADQLNAWQYLHATVVLWGAAILWRGLRYAFHHGIFTRLPQASIEALSTGVLRIRIPMPSNRTWSAGSHVFLRFLRVRPLESHPFTISSLPAPPAHGPQPNDLVESHEMVFLVRPCDGMTAQLMRLASASATPLLYTCLVDGPYGECMDMLRACDSVVLLAGGSGMSCVMPIAQALQRAGPARGMSCCGHVEAHWATRDAAWADWFPSQVKEVKGLFIYHTGPQESEPKTGAGDGKTDEELIGNGADSASASILRGGRPDIGHILRQAAQYPGRTGVLVCGPPSMALEVRNTVAALQGLILGCSREVKCSELELYEESFHF